MKRLAALHHLSLALCAPARNAVPTPKTPESKPSRHDVKRFVPFLQHTLIAGCAEACPIQKAFLAEAHKVANCVRAKLSLGHMAY